MDYHERVTQLIYESIDEVNEMSNLKLPIKKTAETVLMGRTSTIDSLTFVNLTAVLEEKIEREFKERISVIDLLFASKSREWSVAEISNAMIPHLNHVPADKQAQDVGQ